MTIDYSKFDKIEDSDDEKPQTSTAKPEAKLADKPSCQNCYKEELAKPLRCGVCKKVQYCSAKCQKEDWSFHKRVCKKAEEPKPKEPLQDERTTAEKLAAENEKKAKAEAKKAERKRRDEDEKITEHDEDLTWYRHREWKPTAEAKKEFTPQAMSQEAAQASATAKPSEGSEWNKAGTWEDKDVTEFALSGLRAKLVDFPSVDVAGGSLGATGVEGVEGEASKPVIRGKRRHMFDLSFKLKFGFKWMDASGQRSAAGMIEVNDFTNDTFTEGVETEPGVRLSFSDSRLLDTGRKQALLDALGAASWPPSKGSLMAGCAAKMEAWAHEYEKA